MHPDPLACPSLELGEKDAGTLLFRLGYYENNKKEQSETLRKCFANDLWFMVLILTKPVFGLRFAGGFPMQEPVPGDPLQFGSRKAQIEFAAATNTSVTVIVIYGGRCHRRPATR